MPSPAPIRALFVIGSLTGGGSERQLIDILRHLDRDRFTPLLYLIYNEGDLVSEVPADVRVTSFWDNYEWPKWNFPGTILRQQGRQISRTIEEWSVDVVCDRNFNVTLASSMATRSSRTPRVSVVDCEPSVDVEANAGRFRAMKRLMLQRAYRAANQVVAVSKGVRDGLIEYYGLRDDNITLIPNSVDVERIDRLAEEFKPSWNDDRFRIVCVGRLQPQKGYPHLLEAVRMLVHERSRDDLHVSICGDGPQDGELRHFIDQHNLADHVELLGYQANPFPYVKHADLFCMPSLYEGMPTALAEAMACGTPVVATDCPSGPREMLADGQFGRLVPAGDAGVLADAIDDAQQDNQPPASTGDAARQRIIDDFSITTCVRRYEDLLATVVAGRAQ